jgi:hypothetical protein
MVSVHFTHSALISACIDLDQGVGRSHIWPIVAREGSSKEIRVIEQEVPRLTAPEQIVFSGTGFSQSANTPIYFCIWCESDSSNPYAGQCNGSMSFSAFHLTKHECRGQSHWPMRSSEAYSQSCSRDPRNSVA